jgi:hypothetical protein
MASLKGNGHSLGAVITRVCKAGATRNSGLFEEVVYPEHSMFMRMRDEILPRAKVPPESGQGQTKPWTIRIKKNLEHDGTANMIRLMREGRAILYDTQIF